MTTKTANAIPPKVALRLCEQTREENRGKWYRWTAWWCWGCEKASKGDPARMCFSNQPAHRGCLQVNNRYDRQSQAVTR
jgi:hypothetical protein